jgi:rfaE bifunctional protein kinase chain/domain
MNPAQLEAILSRFPQLKVCVIGDLFLDKYLDLEGALTETSLETGLDAYQVTQVRCYPGAAGTIASNLAALGLGQVAMLSLVGDDGEGYDVRAALRRAGIDDSWLRVQRGFHTPTYTKPMLRQGSDLPRELNRLDIKNRVPLPREAEEWVLQRLEAAGAVFDAIVVADQVQERNVGLITDRVRARLAELAAARPQVVFLVDSRCRIGEFRQVVVKPNRAEAEKALGVSLASGAEEARLALALSERTGSPVYLTLGEQGLLIAHSGQTERVSAYRVSGEIDIVGAGDSTTAGIVATLCSGGTLRQAGIVGCLVASITIEQLGVTGTASPEDVRRRFAEYLQQHPEEA